VERTTSNKRKNTLLVANYAPNVGYAWWLMEMFWVQVASYQEACESQTFIAYPEFAEVPALISESTIQAVKLRVDFGCLQIMGNMCQFVRDNEIKIVYLTDRAYFEKRYALLRAAGVEKIIVHDHTPGDRPKVRGLKRVLKKIRNRFTKYTADFFINVSPYMTERSINNGCIPVEKCLTVQNGVEPFAIDSRHKVLVRKELGIDDDAVVVVTSGRMHPYKQIDLIVKSFAEALKNTEEKIELIIVGDGPETLEIARLIGTLGISKRVHMVGFRSDIQDILQAADIAIHAAKGEGFSLSIAEYMSAKLPVIVPDTPSVCQAITDNVQGMIFPQGDFSAAARCILSIAESKSKRMKMAEAAKLKSDSQYSLSNCVEQFNVAIGRWYTD
jgi:glycosyltransferase involved in cell wall biosynthesis